MNNKKLFVGNLPYATTDDQLRDMFAEAGEVVSASVIIDRATGRSKGFGFVEMATEADAQKAIDQLHNRELEGRPMMVNVARPKEERAPSNSRW